MPIVPFVARGSRSGKCCGGRSVWPPKEKNREGEREREGRSIYWAAMETPTPRGEERAFTLPHGYLAPDGRVHREGTMRRALAADARRSPADEDEIDPDKHWYRSDMENSGSTSSGIAPTRTSSPSTGSISGLA